MKLVMVVLFAATISICVGLRAFPTPISKYCLRKSFLSTQRPTRTLSRLAQCPAERATPGWSRQDDKQLAKQIYSVAVPALAACVVEPALTMVDMYFIGTQANQPAATAGLASLSVTGAVFNIIAAITYPLCSGTTAVISRSKVNDVCKGSAQQCDMSRSSPATGSSAYDVQQQAEKQLGIVLLNGLLLSTIIGSTFAVLLQLFSRPLVQSFFALDASVVDIAVRYLQIRGWSLPFTLISYVVIGFCLAVQDVKTPLISILVSSVVNIIGDFLLVGNGGGLAGAAAATSIASTVSALVVMQRLLSKYVPCDRDQTVTYNIAQWSTYIDTSKMKHFFSTSLALLVGSFANTLTYSAGARITSFVQGVQNAGVGAAASAVLTAGLTATSTSISSSNAVSSAATSAATVAAGMSTATVHVAAHQIAMQLWWFMSYFSSPFGLAAEAILPRDLTARNYERVDKGITRTLQCALTVATLCTICVAILLKFRPAMFTSDLAVQSQVQVVLVPVLISQFLICITTIVDGIFIGTNRVRDYITVSIASTTAAWLYYAFLATKYGLGITGTWNGLLIFCGVRAAYYAAKFLSGSLYNYQKDAPTLK